MDLSSVGYRIRQSKAATFLDTIGMLGIIRSTFESTEYYCANGRIQATFDGTSVEYQTESKKEFTSLRHLLKTESRNLTDFANELRPTDTVYDVGAHLGIYTRLAEQILTEGNVIAFELATQNAERLREETSSKTTVVHRAVSNKSGVPYDPHNEAVAGSVTTSLVESEESSAETISIDKYNTNGPNIIKIDVEGHECEVIDGGENTLSRDECRVVYIEIHTPDSKSEVVTQLRELGFTRIQMIDDRGTQELIKATGTT